MGAWYKTGTIAATNGNATITGTGTLWASQVKVGDLLYIDTRLYEVLTVASDTSITLATTYAGTTGSGKSYALIRNFSDTTAADLAARLSTLLTKYDTVADGVGAGKFADGSAAAPSYTFGNDLDTGIYRIGPNSLGLSTAGVLRATVDANGQIGINTAPLVKFHVRSSASANTRAWTPNPNLGFLVESDTIAGVHILSGSASQGRLWFSDSDAELRGAVVYDHSTDALTLMTAGGSRVVVDSTGGVAINGGTPLKRLLSASASLDFPSLAAGAETSLTMTVTGAVGDDPVFVTCATTGASALNRLIVRARVSAANTVTIYLYNPTSGAVDVPALTWKATVMGF